MKGDKLGTYLRDLLTSNIQMASIERQVSRVEELVNEFEKDINRSLDKFTQQNRLNEKFYEDFGGVYMMLLSTLMQLKVEKEDIRGMQAKGDAYAQRNYLAGKK